MKFIQKWQARNLSEPDFVFPATVPGNVQKDYAAAKGFTDVQYADSYKQFLPIEDDHWEYSTVLAYEKKPGERVYFVSGGIDYRYEIRLNGQKLYEYEGIFKPVDLDLTDGLAEGKENILTVHIFPHPKSGVGKAGTRDEANRSTKPAVCYGWDWNPRLLISGLYRESYLETRRADDVVKAEPTYLLSADRKVAELTVTPVSPKNISCRLSVFDPDGTLLYEGENKTVRIENVKLWWCRERGAQNLYEWKLTGESGHAVSGKIGFRTVEFVRNEGTDAEHGFPKSRYPVPFTMILNGERVFLKGTNFVNPDIYWGDADEKRYRELLTLVAGANMNIIRLWGGASVHHPALYEICDELGIFVWQEFMLGCNCYPNEDHYLSVLESEATEMIKTLRTHPCLALWCGGNELFNSWSNMTDQSLPLRLLNSLCYRYDRNTPFIATAPLFGMGHGDYIFYDERYGKDVYQMFGRDQHIAFSEFGVPSIAPMEILRKIIPAGELGEITPTESWTCHHATLAWRPESHACLGVLTKYFGAEATVEERVAQSQWLQCEGLKFIYEEARRLSPHTSAALAWAFNEPWYCAANLSIVSYPASPKPAYYAVKDALRPISFTARISRFDWRGTERFTAEIWLMNDTAKDVTADAEVTLCVGGIEVPLLSWKGAHVGPFANVEGASVCCVLPNVDADRMTLRIRANDPALDSAYVLKYKPSAGTPVSHAMNTDN